MTMIRQTHRRLPALLVSAAAASCGGPADKSDLGLGSDSEVADSRPDSSGARDSGGGDSGVTDSAAGDSGVTDSDGNDSGGGDSGGTLPVVGPCADGGWGGLDPSEGAAAVVVAMGGDDGAAGDLAAPLASLSAALDLARGAGRAVLVSPGTYPAQLVLNRDDDGLRLVGCGADAVTLTAIDPEEPLIFGGEGTFEVSGLRLEGGTRALWFWQGATVTLSALEVIGSTRTGILFEGSDTVVFAESITVADTVPALTESGVSVGYGVLIGGGQVLIRDSLIQGSSGAGVLADQADLTLENVEVFDTLPDPTGRGGRGLQAQNYGTLTVRGGLFSGNQDAGLMVLSSFWTEIDGVVVEDTLAGTLSGGTSTGDGIVVAQASGALSNPALFSTEVRFSTVTGSARAGILVADVTALLDGNIAVDNGYLPDGATTSILAQGVADTSSSSDLVTVLTEPLELDALLLDPAGATP